MERLRNACTDLQEALVGETTKPQLTVAFFPSSVAVSNVFSSKVTHEYKLPTATQVCVPMSSSHGS